VYTNEEKLLSAIVPVTVASVSANPSQWGDPRAAQ